MNKPLLTAAVAGSLATGTSLTQPAIAQDDVDQRFGTVHFATSCNELAQRRFDRGMRYQHSFWYAQAKEIFEEAAKADPSCGMAYWGVALTLLNNPHNAPPASNLPFPSRHRDRLDHGPAGLHGRPVGIGPAPAGPIRRLSNRGEAKPP